MTKFMNYLIKQTGRNYLPPKHYHCYGDWLSHNAETPNDVIYTAYFAYCADLMSRIAQVLGKKSDTKKYKKLFDKIKSAFNKAYIDKNYKIKGDTQTSYILAIVYNLVDGKAKDKAAEFLIEKIEERNNHLSTGFVGTKDIMTALEKIGRNDVAYKLLFNKSYPSWGFSVKHGATSIWERWNGWTPDEGFGNEGMNLFVYYVYGVVYLWIVEIVGGIKFSGAAFKKIIIKPVPGGDLTKAKCEYKSINGKIITKWKLSKNTFSLNVDIPVNTTAEIYVPAGKAEDVKESGKYASRVKGIKFIEMEDGCAVFAVGSGKYKFDV